MAKIERIVVEVGLHYDVFVDAIAEEAERLRQAADGHMHRQVPTCPEWEVAQLVDHVTMVMLRQLAQIRAENPNERTVVEIPEITGDDEKLAYFDETAHVFVSELSDRSPNSPCWNYVGEDLVASWVARRLAHETAIHRIDAELASGEAGGIETELAADGFAERVSVVLPTRVSQSTATLSLGGSLGLVCVDFDMPFVVEIERGKWRYRNQRGPADCVVVGSAADLFRFSWGRPTQGDLQITGDVAIVAAWGTLPG